jgi:hypothetical protein
MTTKFLSDAQLEGMAARLLRRYDSLFGAVSSLPVPVERILEDVLDLSILWDDISEPPNQSILAALDPGSKTVVFNESRRTLLTDTPGLYYTVLAHEAGHWDVHVDHGHLAQPNLPNFAREFSCLYRSSGPGQDLREVQAHRFMGFLLMPSNLLMEAVRDVDLLSWPMLYGLRDRFQVTITALKVRLERLGLLYVTEDGELYPSRQEYEGQMRLGD